MPVVQQRWAWVVGGLVLIAVAILAWVLAGRGHSNPPVVADSPVPSATTVATRPTPSPAPSVYLGPGQEFGSGARPGDVSMTMAVQNLTALPLRIVSVNLEMTNAGEAQVLSADIVPTAFSSIPPEGDLPVIESRSSGTMTVHVEPDCTHQAAEYELDVHLTAGSGPIVSQRLDFPSGIYLPTLIAASCQPGTVR